MKIECDIVSVKIKRCVEKNLLNNFTYGVPRERWERKWWQNFHVWL